MNADANDPSDEPVVDSAHAQADDATDGLTEELNDEPIDEPTYESTDEPTDAAYGDLDENPDITDTTDTTDTAGDVDDPMDAGEAAAEVPFEPVDLTPDAPVPSPPVTGDAVIDESMAELAEAQAGSNAERIDAGERAHRKLQGRLADLGGA